MENSQIFERRRSRSFVYVEMQNGQDRVIYNKNRRSSVVFDLEPVHPPPPPVMMAHLPADDSPTSSPQEHDNRARWNQLQENTRRTPRSSLVTNHSRGVSMTSTTSSLSASASTPSSNATAWRILLIYKNKSISNVIFRYLSSFGASVMTACDIQDVFKNANVYFNKPLDAIAIDELCLPVTDGSQTLVKAIRRMASICNQQQDHLPSTPLMVLFLFAKLNVDEEVLDEFKTFIRKPLYLSPFEKLFYNDLPVVKQYTSSAVSPTEQMDDSDLKAAIKPLDMLNLLKNSLANSELPHQRDLESAMTPTRRKSGERIFVNFEVRPMKRASVSESARRSSYPMIHASDEVVAVVTHTTDKNYTGPSVSLGTRRQSLAPELFASTGEEKSKTLMRFLSFRTIAAHKKVTTTSFDLNHSPLIKEAPRLLMAEDQVINQKVTKKILEAFGVSVDIANNGVEAMKMLNIQITNHGDDHQDAVDSHYNDMTLFNMRQHKIHQQREWRASVLALDENGDSIVTPGGTGRTTLFDYDLIIMDGNMPQMDGIEATRRIRMFEDSYFRSDDPFKINHKAIPIIGLTASSVEAYQDNCVEAGMDEVLTKPVDRKELEQMLVRYLPQNPNYKR
ncbi:hypothetical protein AKO1_011744 [Acrasis kona]|uniref:Response regulatory domain-containing protein n=1 Tax=Acrasis kona TaxID=1008807 RepID=A0AAW2Z895_9EUKA